MALKLNDDVEGAVEASAGFAGAANENGELAGAGGLASSAGAGAGDFAAAALKNEFAVWASFVGANGELNNDVVEMLGVEAGAAMGAAKENEGTAVGLLGSVTGAGASIGAIVCAKGGKPPKSEGGAASLASCLFSATLLEGAAGAGAGAGAGGVIVSPGFANIDEFAKKFGTEDVVDVLAAAGAGAEASVVGFAGAGLGGMNDMDGTLEKNGVDCKEGAASGTF